MFDYSQPYGMDGDERFTADTVETRPAEWDDSDRFGHPETPPGNTSRRSDGWWRCHREGPVSGRYRGEMTIPDSGRYELLLRVDIDPRHSNSPVMDRISGDIFQRNSVTDPSRTFDWKVYRGSWIVDSPNVTWNKCHVDINGLVRYWGSFGGPRVVNVRIPWATFRPAGPAEVRFWQPGGFPINQYTCQRESDAFRELTLEVDICDSVNSAFVLPEHDTHTHTVRPSGLRQRTLTIEEAYREAGVEVTVNPEHTIIDDSAPEFGTWSVAELHDALETHFSQYTGRWPKWHMWGLLATKFDRPSVLGVMFDAGVAGGGAEPPERQGFTVFRNHSWFDELPTGTPSTPTEAAIMREYLFTWIHEMGHAFNFLHSWDKGRPGSLSWMNYPDQVNEFWDRFEFRYDDQELLHLRHGDRNAVIMGGDPFATGRHLEGTPETTMNQLSPAEGESPVELLVRSSGYFEFLEEMQIELRLRNRMSDQPVNLDRRLRPEFGRVTILIHQPDGTVVRFKPAFHLLGARETISLGAPGRTTEGEDRYSETIFIGYGKDGNYFEQPGEYQIRVGYQDREDFLLVSNTHSIRVGTPQSREEDRLAQEYFTDDVGLCLAFNGSQSPHLDRGMEVLEQVADRFEDTPAGAKAATTVAAGLKEPFFSIRNSTVTKLEDAKQEEALQYTESARNFYQRTDDKSQNIPYHELVRIRTELLKELDNEEQAREEVETLVEDLADRGVNQPVLADIRTFGENI